MRVEPRLQVDPVNRERKYRGLVLIAETIGESALLDAAFGSNVIDDEGLIAFVKGEVRMSDGYGEHYVFLVKAP